MVESITAIPRRFGAWLALLALALQLGLSIGHVHKINPDWGHAAGLSWAFVLTAALCVILAIVFETARLDPVPQLTLLRRRYFSPAQQRAPPPVAIPT